MRMDGKGLAGRIREWFGRLKAPEGRRLTKEEAMKALPVLFLVTVVAMLLGSALLRAVLRAAVGGWV